MVFLHQILLENETSLQHNYIIKYLIKFIVFTKSAQFLLTSVQLLNLLYFKQN